MCNHDWNVSIWSNAKAVPGGAWLRCKLCNDLVWIGLMPPPSHRGDDSLYEERIAALGRARVAVALEFAPYRAANPEVK